MVRYFMTIPEAVGLVLQSCAQGNGGEIFVLDMGKPVRIADLARQMIELSGLKPGVDIEIKHVGLRPGEKLFEELRCTGENYQPTRHPSIMSFVHPAESLDQVRLALRRLEAEVHSLDAAEIKLRIRQLVPEYTPCLERDRRGPAPGPASGSLARQGAPEPLSLALPSKAPVVLAGAASAA